MDTSNGMLGGMETIEERLNEVMTAVGLGTCNIDTQQESDVIKRTHSEMYVLIN
jgi:hypothetical protein